MSIAIRYFAGGRPEDISLVHGVSHSEVFNSVWKVVDAVLACEQLAFSFPSDHKTQKEIAAGFKARSQPQFDNCCGAIDGMLLWIEKPSKAECEKAGCGSKKFFCGRKHKFGLNMQATCDSECRFLDVCIQHPASTSDFLAFTTSSLYHKLEEKDFIAPGLCIFGDAAYTNGRYMATPFKGVSSGSKDDYNFFHSQLRIRIECAFGLLVGRWGILRRALPSQLGIMKVTSLCVCLCRLHNYCVNERLAISDFLPSDSFDIITNGGFPLTDNSDTPPCPEELLDAGNHFEDTTEAFRRQFSRRGLNKDETLPRDKLHKTVFDGHFCRPTPEKWKGKSNNNTGK